MQRSNNKNGASIYLIYIKIILLITLTCKYLAILHELGQPKVNELDIIPVWMSQHDVLNKIVTQIITEIM